MPKIEVVEWDVELLHEYLDDVIRRGATGVLLVVYFEPDEEKSWEAKGAGKRNSDQAIASLETCKLQALLESISEEEDED